MKLLLLIRSGDSPDRMAELLDREVTTLGLNPSGGLYAL